LEKSLGYEISHKPFGNFYLFLVITCFELHRNPFVIFVKRTKYIWHGTEAAGTKQTYNECLHYSITNVVAKEILYVVGRWRLT